MLLDNNMTFNTHKSGYTLLFAVLTAALVLGVAVFVLSISKKQYQLAVQARESMYSFYAADSAIECISLNNNAISSTAPFSFYCDNPSVPINFNDGTSGNSFVVANGPSEFDNGALQLKDRPIKLSNGTCALVTITTGQQTITIGQSGLFNTVPKTTIEARGYNNCDASGLPIVSTRSVERAIRLTLPYGI